MWDRAEDIMTRVFHQLANQKKAMKDVENLTMKQMDYTARRAVRVLREDYPELSEAENPAEELHRLAAKKAPYAKWKASDTAEEGQGASSKKKSREKAITFSKLKKIWWDLIPFDLSIFFLIVEN